MDCLRMRKEEGISIHALRGEGDVKVMNAKNAIRRFQSTPSVGRATAAGKVVHDDFVISIHALRGEGDETHPV